MTIKDYAFLDKDNIVVNVVIIDDEEDETLFQKIAEQHNAVKWLDTSVYGITEINGHFDGERLWVEKPFPSWVKGDKEWVAPVPYPSDGLNYYWEESALEWILIKP